MSEAGGSAPTVIYRKVDRKLQKELAEALLQAQRDRDDTVYWGAVPIIDLNVENAGELIGQACKAWGMFQVINHKIPKTLFAEVEHATNNLFSLPLEQKMKVARVPGGRTGYGCPYVNASFAKDMWTSEGFTMAGSPLEHARQLWLDNYQKFCDTMEEYQQAMKELAARLLRLMLGALGVTEEDVAWATGEGAAGFLHLNHYPACPDPDRTIGLAEHTDSSILSIVHQSNDICGLQVLPECRDAWVAVPPHPDALVVNLGDLMYLLSNGKYQNALHRALTNRNQPRLSVVYLHGPPSGVEIGPLPKLVHESGPLYKSVSWEEIVRIKEQTITAGNLGRFDFRLLHTE